MNNTVESRLEAGVLTLTLNRPQQLNALNPEMIEGLYQALSRADDDAAVRAVLIRGAGEHFMAGGDLKWFKGEIEVPVAERRPRFEKAISAAHASTLLVRHMNKPVVAAVRGAAAGFGLSLVLACDLALAAEDAYFTLAYCNVGLSPDGGATWSLPRVVGARRAAEIALLGDRFDAAQAAAWGVVNRVVPGAELDAEAAKLAARLAAGPSQAIGRTKRLLQASSTHTLAEQLAAEQENFAACACTGDFVEGLTAFFEKRRPRFS